MSTNSSDMDAVRALFRFGLGPRPGDRARIAGDPRGALRAELEGARIALDGPKLRPTPAIARDLAISTAVLRAQRGVSLNPRQQEIVDDLRRQGRFPAPGDAPEAKPSGADRMAGMGAEPSAMTGDAEEGASAPIPSPTAVSSRSYAFDVAARLDRVRSCGIGFAERLAMFWTNHFAVGAQKSPVVRAFAGPFDREAIRPYALGRFADLLDAATRHPAMLHYLDNAVSVGPDSRAGKIRNRGLNENHARELLELHTVGVDGGYDQADVTAFAKTLTGWGVETKPDVADVGGFRFEPRRHEPGPQTIMGRTYPEGGEEQAQAVLDDLARHPATARHVARRLAIAFVSDEPPQPLVDRLARTFRDTDGDLTQLAVALIESDEAWSEPARKLRSPQEFVFASLRALSNRSPRGEVMRGLASLGQPFWQPPSPKGYPIAGVDWLAPDAQTNRLDLAADLASQAAGDADPNGLAEDLLGPALSDETRTAVKRAGSREQALALLLMSPEMQRR